MARVASIWISPGKGSARMDGRESVNVLATHGLEGCDHGGRGKKRQVLFASAEHLRSVGVEPGQIRENLTVEGADVQRWPIGQRVRVGAEAEFEITEVCEPCHKMDALRPGLRAELDDKRGMLARVVRGGSISAGDDVTLL
jgi:MOSC domain-containing protein YiiM